MIVIACTLLTLTHESGVITKRALQAKPTAPNNTKNITGMIGIDASSICSCSVIHSEFIDPSSDIRNETDINAAAVTDPMM